MCRSRGTSKPQRRRLNGAILAGVFGAACVIVWLAGRFSTRALALVAVTPPTPHAVPHSHAITRPRSVRRRKVRAAKLIADGLWVDLRRGKYDPIRQLRVGTPDATTFRAYQPDQPLLLPPDLQE